MAVSLKPNIFSRFTASSIMDYSKQAIISGSGTSVYINSLVQVLNYFHPLEPGMVDFFQRHIVPMNAKKGTHLLRAGMVCTHIYFVEKGVLRGYFMEGDKDITTWITAENEMVTSITSLDKEIPAIENIEAIEDCRLLAISSQHMKQLYEEYPAFNIVGRKLLQEYYRDAESRAYVVRLSSAGVKYQYFMEKYSQLANRISLKYIASFLGITLETLSRVRSRMSKTT